MHSIAAAMSGGVDSSTAACLLRQEGYDLIGITLRLFSNEDTETVDRACCSLEDVEDARQAAQRLGFPHYTFNLSEDFREHVIAPFISAYEQGRTPNPCIDCNRHIKFGALLRRVEELGREGVATGHYVRRSYDAGADRYLLYRARHLEKDQSYVLYCLTQEQLSRSLFPLGELSKDEVRAIAREQGLAAAHKGESQDICFVPDGDYGSFLRRYTGKDYPSGPFLDAQGRVLGQHRGIVDYTLGQRRGLGVSSDRGRLYVQRIDPAANTVTLTGNAALFSSGLEARQINLIPCAALEGSVRLQAKVRYRQAVQPCTVRQTGEDCLRVEFDSPQRAVTPGQAVVLYDGDLVVGGGVIDRVLGDQT